MHFNSPSFKNVKLGIGLSLLLYVASILASCSGGGGGATTIQGAWYLESSLDAPSRYSAVLFTIGNKIYISTGYNNNNGINKYYNDLWVYDVDIDTWTNLNSNLPGTARKGAVAFSANNKGYVGLGFDGNQYLNDFYVYDPVDNSWDQIASFPGAPRVGAFAFSIDDIGYVGTGNDDELHFKDFYQYDAENNVWIQKPSVPKTERTNAFSFVIDGKGYVGGGLYSSASSSVVQDFYEFDPSLGKWAVKNDLQDDKIDTDTNDKGYTISRDQAVTFVLNGLAYVVGGKRGGSYSSDTWEYNPQLDTWIKKSPFIGGSRFGAVGFAVDNIGYVGTGIAGSNYLNDKWSYDPTIISQP